MSPCIGFRYPLGSRSQHQSNLRSRQGGGEGPERSTEAQAAPPAGPPPRWSGPRPGSSSWHWEGEQDWSVNTAPSPSEPWGCPASMTNLSIHQISPGIAATEQSCRSPLLTFTTQPCPMAPCLCPLQPATHMGSALVTSTHPPFTGSGGGCHSQRPQRSGAWTTLCPPAAPRALAPGSCVATIRHPGPRPAPGTGRQPPRPCTLPSHRPGFCPRPVLPAWVQPGDRTPCPLGPTGQQQRGWRGVQPLSGWGSGGRHSLERGRGLGRGEQAAAGQGRSGRERVTKDLHHLS